MTVQRRNGINLKMKKESPVVQNRRTAKGIYSSPHFTGRMTYRYNQESRSHSLFWILLYNRNIY